MDSSALGRPLAVPGDSAIAERFGPHALSAWPRRYRWPMRLFLCCYLFDIVVHGFLAVMPWLEWVEEYRVHKYPELVLPTRAEIAAIQTGTDQNFESVPARVGAAFQSLCEFMIPWPSADSRKQIGGPSDAMYWSGGWVLTRLRIIDAFFGLSQEWPMFAPDVVKREIVMRYRLHYADGSVMELRSLAEPADLLRYSRWFCKKMLAAHSNSVKDYDSRLGLCMYLSHCHASNDLQSPLAYIDLYRVHYYFPSPTDDPTEFLSAQQNPPSDRIEAPFCRYEVSNKTLKNLSQ